MRPLAATTRIRIKYALWQRCAHASIILLLLAMALAFEPEERQHMGLLLTTCQAWNHHGLEVNGNNGSSFAASSPSSYWFVCMC